MSTFSSPGLVGQSRILYSRAVLDRVGFSFGDWLTKKGQRGFLAVAADTSESEHIKQQLISGLNMSGWEVLDMGKTTLPLLAWYASTHHTVGGCLYVSSPSPLSETVSITLLSGSVPLTQAEIADLEKDFSATSGIPRTKKERSSETHTSMG